MKRTLFLVLSAAAAVAQTGCRSTYDTGQVVSYKDGLPVNQTAVVRRRMQPVPDGDIDGVRYGEIVKVYAANRYVDPTDPRTMHERHAVYRVEQDPQFVLNAKRRKQETILGPIVGLRRPEYAPSALPNEVGREVLTARRNSESLTQAVGSLARNQEIIAQQLQQNAATTGRTEANLGKALIEMNRRMEGIAKRQREADLNRGAAPGPEADESADAARKAVDALKPPSGQVAPASTAPPGGSPATATPPTNP
jgi:hypothetical protein